MKKVLLLGDSIRQNYQQYVREHLEGKAEVFYPDDNGRFCSFTLRHLHDYVRIFTAGDRKNFDIIHFNFGLWDVLRLSNEERTFTSRQEYGELLVRLCSRMEYLCPGAKKIFALTTSVVEPGFGPGDSMGKRCNVDIEQFNHIAQAVLRTKVDSINDLWKVSMDMPKFARSDNVHFQTELGVERLGRKVVESISAYVDRGKS